MTGESQYRSGSTRSDFLTLRELLQNPLAVDGPFVGVVQNVHLPERRRISREIGSLITLSQPPGGVSGHCRGSRAL